MSVGWEEKGLFEGWLLFISRAHVEQGWGNDWCCHHDVITRIHTTFIIIIIVVVIIIPMFNHITHHRINNKFMCLLCCLVSFFMCVFVLSLIFLVGCVLFYYILHLLVKYCLSVLLFVFIHSVFCSSHSCNLLVELFLLWGLFVYCISRVL